MKKKELIRRGIAVVFSVFTAVGMNAGTLSMAAAMDQDAVNVAGESYSDGDTDDKEEYSPEEDLNEYDYREDEGSEEGGYESSDEESDESSNEEGYESSDEESDDSSDEEGEES